MNHPRHLLRILFWLAIAIILGGLALVAEGKPTAPRRSQEPRSTQKSLLNAPWGESGPAAAILEAQ